MAIASRALFVAGALLASASLAQAGDRGAFAAAVLDEHADLRPIETPAADLAQPSDQGGSTDASKPATAVAPASMKAADAKTAGPSETSRRKARLVRKTAKAVAVAALKATFPAASADVASGEAAPSPTEAAAPTPPVLPTPGGPREAASGTVSELLEKHARLNGVPLKLAEAVVRIESRGNVRAAHAGALGLMQLKYGTARAAGFSGPAIGLFAADTNLQYGMKILGNAYRAAGGDACGALMRYQSGHLATHMTSANRAYCSKARAIMAGA